MILKRIIYKLTPYLIPLTSIPLFLIGEFYLAFLPIVVAIVIIIIQILKKYLRGEKLVGQIQFRLVGRNPLDIIDPEKVDVNILSTMFLINIGKTHAYSIIIKIFTKNKEKQKPIKHPLIPNDKIALQPYLDNFVKKIKRGSEIQIEVTYDDGGKFDLIPYNNKFLRLTIIRRE